MNFGNSVDLYINGEKTSKFFIDEDVTCSVMNLLEREKDPNHSIVGIYNRTLKEIDIIRGEDDFSTFFGTAELIKNYHGDLLDVELFGITNTALMRHFLGFLSKQFKFLRYTNKKEKGIGLVKRDR